MAHRTYLMWYRKPESVPYPIVILEGGVVVANVYTRLAYQDQPGDVEIMSRDDHRLMYDDSNTKRNTWKSVSRCEVRKFMRKYYPMFDAKLL